MFDLQSNVVNVCYVYALYFMHLMQVSLHVHKYERSDSLKYTRYPWNKISQAKSQVNYGIVQIYSARVTMYTMDILKFNVHILYSYV